MRPPPTNRPNRTPFWMVLLRVLGAGLLLAIGVRIAWGYYADRLLTAQLDKLRAAGRPLSFDGLERRAIPPESDAAPILWRAQKAYNQHRASFVCGIRALKGEKIDCPMTLDDWREFRQSVDPIIADLRAAARLPSIDLSRLSPRAIPAFASSVSSALSALQFAALLELRDGRFVDALHDLEAILRLADLVTEQHSTYGGVSAFSATVSVRPLVQQLCSAFPSDPGAPQSALTGEARDTLARIIAALYDDERRRDVWRGSVNASRIQFLERFSPMWSQPKVLAWVPPSPAVLLSPLAKTDAARELDYLRRVEDAADSISYAALSNLHRDNDFDATQARRMGRPLYRVSGMDFYLSTVLRLIAEDRVNAAALAAKLHELDHGHLPANLDQLAPEYLPAVPLDPFSEPVSPLQYTPADPEPIVFSVFDRDELSMIAELFKHVQTTGGYKMAISLERRPLPPISEYVVPNDDQPENQERNPDPNDPEGGD